MYDLTVLHFRTELLFVVLFTLSPWLLLIIKSSKFKSMLMNLILKLTNSS
jgi:hypothetical protein